MRKEKAKREEEVKLGDKRKKWSLKAKKIKAGGRWDTSSGVMTRSFHLCMMYSYTCHVLPLHCVCPQFENTEKCGAAVLGWKAAVFQYLCVVGLRVSFVPYGVLSGSKMRREASYSPRKSPPAAEWWCYLLVAHYPVLTRFSPVYVIPSKFRKSRSKIQIQIL